MSDFSMDKEFSELAHVALNKKAPHLLPFVSGFQTLTGSEDNSRAVGMFGVSLGTHIYFIPVFFMKGTLKPLSLIFDYSGNQFMPFDNEWLSYLFKADKHSIGSIAEDPRGGFSGLTNPSADAMINKTASENKFPNMEDLAMEKKSSRSGSWFPKYLMKSSSETQKAFVKMLGHEKLAQEVQKHIGLDMIKEALTMSTKIRDGVEGVAEPATEDGGVEVITNHSRSVKKSVLDKVPVSAREDFMREGFHINDNRKETASLYSTQYASEFSEPYKSGEFSVIKTDGSLTRAMVLHHPHALVSNTGSDQTMVYLPGSKRWKVSVPKTSSEYYSSNDSCLVSPVKRSEDIVEKTLAQTVSAKAMRPGLSYLLMTPDLKSTVVFKVTSILNSDSGSVSYKINVSGSYGTEDTYLAVGVGKASSFKRVGSSVLVPHDAVALQMDRENNNLQLGNLETLSSLLIHQGISPLMVSHDGVEYNVSGCQNMDKVAALNSLLIDHNLSKKDSLDLIKEASEMGKVSVLVKQATPTPINFTSTSDQPWGAVKGPAPVEQHPTFERSNHISFEDPFLVQPTPELALTASKMDRNIFDASLLTSLAEVGDPSEEISSYIPDMELAVDKIGRLLFLLWWKYDDFRKSFSPSELVTMEGDLKNLLSKLGTVTLRLKKKMTLMS